MAITESPSLPQDARDDGSRHDGHRHDGHRHDVHPARDIAPLARLAALHVEAEETARLARLLDCSPPACATLLGLGAFSFLAGAGGSLGTNFAWSLLVLIGICAMLVSAVRAARAPLTLPALRHFTSELTAGLLYTGFAWGAGAFLILPAGGSIAGPLLFAVIPAAAIAALLRERVCVFAFLAPVAALSSFAAGLRRPGPGAALEAALILAVLAIMAMMVWLRARPARQEFFAPR